MRRLSLLLPAVVILLFCARSHAACTGVTAGMTEAGVVSAINACSSAGGGTVNFSAGNYGAFTSNFTLPCNVSLSGPVVAYSQTHNQTAILQGSVSSIGQPLQTAVGCSNHQTIQYLEWNGEQPTVTGGGGGFIQVSAGTQNLTVQNNWIHGMNAPSSDAYGDQNTQANGIYFCCGKGSPVTQNVIVTHNEFGSESYGDCAAAMKEQATENGGGFCNGVGVHTNTANVSIDHNIFHYLEQGAKYYEASGYCNPFNMSYNSFSYIQRIPYETQCNAGNSSAPTLMYIQFNYFGNRYNGNGGQQNYDISAANGCGNGPGSYCITHTDYNVDVQNINNPVHGAGYEIWGQQGTTANYNLWEGYVAGAGGAIDWSQNGSFTFNNNTFNIAGGSNTSCTTSTGGYLNHEQNGTAYTPTCTGNAFSNAGSGTYASATPAISPASGPFSGTQTVTLTNTGANRDFNTSIWFTANGSTPVPGASGTTLYTGPFSIASTTTINAVGMWGAENQPTSYPKGMGYVPSGMVSAIYTASGMAPATPVRPTTPVPPVTTTTPVPPVTTTTPVPPVTPTKPVPPVTPTKPVPPVTPITPVAPASPTLTGAYLGTPNNVNTLVVGGTLQFGAMGNYGTSPTPVPIPASQVVWSSSNPAVLTVDGTGKVTAVGAGKANVQDQIGTVNGSAWTITVTGKVLKSAYLGTPNNVNTLVVGGTLQFAAMGNYGTSPTPVPIPASQVVWSSSNPAVITVDATGKVTAVGVGKANVQDQIGTVTGSGWTITTTGNVIKSAYLGTASGAKTMTMGSTMQLTVYVTYADGTTGTLPDASGNVVTSWNTTDHKVAVISSRGQATALSQGVINMEAMVGTLRLSPWLVTVGTVASPAAGPAAVPAAPGAALADTFRGPFWRLVTPVGGSASISNSHLFLGVPGGANHDSLLPSNQAVRVVQAIGRENFDVAIKIDSPLFATDGNTSQGLMILSENEDFITFALTTNGIKIGLNARRVTGGAATTVLDDTDFSQYQNPMYLRVTKAGSAYVAFYSIDGANWTQAVSFTDTTMFSSIGPFASNYSSTPANAAPVVMSVNWFDVQQ
jgi:Bacterial Ig-like domain (group 2)/Chitobiase/beta-hexosaminidase C-terminal domain